MNVAMFTKNASHHRFLFVVKRMLACMARQFVYNHFSRNDPLLWVYWIKDDKPVHFPKYRPTNQSKYYHNVADFRFGSPSPHWFRMGPIFQKFPKIHFSITKIHIFQQVLIWKEQQTQVFLKSYGSNAIFFCSNTWIFFATNSLKLPISR